MTEGIEMSVMLSPESTEPAAWQAPLVALMLALARRRNLIVGFMVVGLLVGAVQYVRTPPYYRSSADIVLLPREKPAVDFSVQSSSMETTEDGAKRADSGSLMLPAQTDLYMSLMTSRAVLERIGDSLAERLTEKSSVKSDDRSDEVVQRLHSMIKLKGSEEGMLTVTVTAGDPQLAADIANLLIAEAKEASKSIERQLLMQQAGYLGEAVKTAQTNLERVEQELKAFCARNALLNPDLQANDRVRQIRELTGKRDTSRVELTRRSMHYTDADPGVQQLMAEIEVTDLRIQELRGQITGDIGEREFGGLYVEYLGMVQEVRFRRDLLATLSTQSDVFRIRAELPAGNIAIVRPASAERKPAGPSKKAVFGVALGAALTLGFALALLLEQLSVVRGHPVLLRQWMELRTALLRPVGLPRLGREPSSDPAA